MWRRYLLSISVLVFLTNSTVHGNQEKRPFSYSSYADILKSYVDDTGMVNYSDLKKHPEKLTDFVATVGKLDPNCYDKWNNEGKIAFWLNVYNAFTLKAIIDNYPIKSSFLTSRFYPKNSIRQISGVWDKMTFKAMAKEYTLEYIEHEIFRKRFNEPRIHMALVCAAVSCPVLRNEPYISDKLDEQLSDQSRKFLADPTKFKFDHDKRILHISPIFKWFSHDFVKATTKKAPFTQYSDKEAAILDFVSKYLDKNHVFFAPSKITIKIKYLKYDWSLNEKNI